MTSPEVTEAVLFETKLGERAAEIRGDAEQITPSLFLELWPLLCEPIPPAFVETVPPTKGKPYPSTGIRSVQVQIDRMNRVLTPLWWWYEDTYALDGKLCTVTVYVGEASRQEGYLTAFSSRGGVQQGSSVGNIHKGSFTNAAKVAFARLGPGHEVYVGAVDLDPDVSPDLAAQEPREDRPAPIKKISESLAQKLVEHAWDAGEEGRLQLAASRLVKRDVGDCSTQEKAVAALTGALTYQQADRLDGWLLEQLDRKGSGPEG